MFLELYKPSSRRYQGKSKRKPITTTHVLIGNDIIMNGFYQSVKLERERERERELNL